MASNLITESMIIPSAATRLYGENFDGHLTLRAMTTKEERIRLSGQSFYQTMSKIVNECIVDNKNPDGTYKIDSQVFTDFDFFAVLVKLRMLSYGTKYKTVTICSKCGRKNDKAKVDLTDLAYNLVPPDFKEPYELKPLPYSGDVLGCRFLRVKDRIDIEKQKELILAKEPNYDGDPTFQLEMQRRIMTVNGKELNYVQAEDYVNNMIAMDSVVYHDEVDTNKFGIIRLNYIESCDNPFGCNGKPIWILRPDSEFFRPCLDS